MVKKVVKRFSEGDSGYIGYVFKRSEFPAVLPEDYDELLEVVGETAQANDIHLDVYYGGPGQAFTDLPGIWVGKYKVLVTQRFGLDI